MEKGQFDTILQMFTQLSGQIESLRQEIHTFKVEVAEEFAKVRQEMADDSAAQVEISKDILDNIGGPFQDLQKKVKHVKLVHTRRLNKIERYIGLA